MIKAVVKFSFVAMLMSVLTVDAQNNTKNNNGNTTDKVLMTINGGKVSLTEFMNVYKKNNNAKVADTTSLEEYLELFVNFKLKVKEAEEMGLDTSSAFKEELSGYRKQLAQPYLTDKEVKERLIKEAYERMQTEVKAGHILVKVDAGAFPKDTLEAYNKAIKIRNRILKGEDFAALAKENSDDPSAKENGGDLGYFTALQMVYPFENAAYATKAGEVSMPIRSRFGYHIIKVFDRRPAQGEVLVSHIMVKFTKEMTAADSLNAKNKINELYEKVKAGENFAALAQEFSDDKASAKSGGELPWFGTNRMPAQFESVAFGLKNNGDVSSPFTTDFGWHIVKRIDKKGLPAYAEMEADLKSKVARDTRSQMGRTSMIEKIKKENNYKEISKSKDTFYKLVDSAYFNGEWKVDKSKLSKGLFVLGEEKYSQADFAKYLEENQSKRPTADVKMTVDDMYKRFVEDKAIAYEEARLDKKYPEFKALMQEYRDGILLFELTDKKVWSKAIKDTVGLELFYQANKDNYKWEERAEASVYTCADNVIVQKVQAMLKKNKSNDDILKEINKDSQLNLKIESRIFQKNENSLIDANWNPGTSKVVKNDNGKMEFVVVSKLLAPSNKTLKEAKGMVTSDYQNHLEKEWIESLKKKYQVEINKEVLSTIQ